MDDTIPARPKFAATDYLALERTFLAWIRTGLALMGFGFVVARFGLFLQMIQHVEIPHAAERFGFSLMFGTALIVIGVGSLAFSSWRYLRLVRSFAQGEDIYKQPLTSAVALAVILALIGLAMAIYLISV